MTDGEVEPGGHRKAVEQAAVVGVDTGHESDVAVEDVEVVVVAQLHHLVAEPEDP